MQYECGVENRDKAEISPYEAGVVSIRSTRSSFRLDKLRYYCVRWALKYKCERFHFNNIWSLFSVFWEMPKTISSTQNVAQNHLYTQWRNHFTGQTSFWFLWSGKGNKSAVKFEVDSQNNTLQTQFILILCRQYHDHKISDILRVTLLTDLGRTAESQTAWWKHLSLFS